MSHLIKSKEQLLMFRELLTDFKENGIRKDVLEKYIPLLVPSTNNKCLVNLKVKERGRNTAIFFPKNRTIELSVSKMYDWIKLNFDSFENAISPNNIKNLEGFLYLAIFCHEIEHSYQYWMGKGEILAPCELVKNGYNKLNSMIAFEDNSFIPNPISKIYRIISVFKYQQNPDFYVLERNANLETFDLLEQLAIFLENDEISMLFNDFKNAVSLIGYTVDEYGSFYETFNKILRGHIYKKLGSDGNLSMEERVRYGLPIDMETREKILNYKIKSKI